MNSSILATSKEFICTVDLAKKRDYTTIQIYRDTPEVRHYPIESGRSPQVINWMDLTYQARMQGVRYTEQSKMIRELLKRTNLLNNTQLIVDGTGVGEAVVDIMREDGLMPLPIVSTGGTNVNPVYADFGKVFGGSSTQLRGAQVLKEMTVPKDDMVHAGMIVLEQGRLRIAENLKHVDDFRKQMARFKGKFNDKSGRTKYENDDDTTHDDFVVTFLLASWWMTYKRVTVKERVVHEQTNADWNPMDFLDSNDFR